MTEIWSGAPVAATILEEVAAALRAGKERGWPPPTLLSIHRGGTTPFQSYLRQQERMAGRTGIGFRSQPLPPGATAGDLRDLVDRANRDPSVDGVLLEHPLPPPLRFADAVDLLRPEKDVDGVGAGNLGRLLAGRPVQAPAVARAALRTARHYLGPLAGRRVAVVGRSPTVGIPIALLAASRGPEGDATVTLAHSHTTDLAASLAGMDVIFSAAGRPGLLDRRVVPRGAAVVDVGTTAVEDPRGPGEPRRLVGDADPADLDGWARALTPVPGGVGPVTVAMLAHNTVRAWQALRAPEER